MKNWSNNTKWCLKVKNLPKIIEKMKENLVKRSKKQFKITGKCWKMSENWPEMQKIFYSSHQNLINNQEKGKKYAKIYQK